MATGVNLTATQYVDFGDIAALSGLTAISVLFEITPSGAPDASTRIFTQWGDTSGEQAIIVAHTSSGKIGFLVNTNNGYKGKETDAGYLSDGVTIRVGLRANDAGVHEIWINGVSVAVSDWNGTGAFGTLNNASSLVAIGFEPDESVNGIVGRYEHPAIFGTLLSDTDMLHFGDGTNTPDELAGAPGIMYVSLTGSSDLTDQFNSNDATNHGGTWDAGGVTPNCTYDDTSISCEAAHADIAPASNTGDDPTSASLNAGSDPLPTGVALNADGTLSITAGSMLAADIGVHHLLFDLTNSGGTQTAASLTLTITANPPVGHWDTANILTTILKATPVATTHDPTHDSGPAIAAGSYAFTPALTGMSINATSGRVTLTYGRDGDRQNDTRVITFATAGGQPGSASVTIRRIFTGSVPVNSGAATWVPILEWGGDSGDANSAMPASAMGAAQVASSAIPSGAF